MGYTREELKVNGGNRLINIYCDESCHLEKDESDVMILGGMSCENSEKNKIYEDIRELKLKFGLSSWFEIKWTKVSLAKIDFYKALVDYFFENNLNFRGIVAENKKHLNHIHFNDGSYDKWYYKMYFLLLDSMIYPIDEYKIFIDIKDTNGGPKVKKLHEVLCNNNFDYNHEYIRDIKQINSNESELLQLTDLFIGALGYKARGLKTSKSKLELIKYIESKEIDLSRTTSKEEVKFNLFIWTPRKVENVW